MVWFNNGKFLILNPQNATTEKPFELIDNIIKVALMKVAYSKNIDSDLTFTQISASEVSTVTNYAVRGDGRELAGKGFTKNDGTDTAEFDATDLVYSTLGGTSNETFNQIVIFREPNAGASNGNVQLIAHAVVASTTTNGGNITLVWNSAGILHIT